MAPCPVRHCQARVPSFQRHLDPQVKSLTIVILGRVLLGRRRGEPPSVVIEYKVRGEWVVQNNYLKSWRETCTLKSVQIVLAQRLTGTHRPSPSHGVGAAFPSKELLSPCLSPLRVPAAPEPGPYTCLGAPALCQPLPGEASVFAPWCPHFPAQILHLLAP